MSAAKRKSTRLEEFSTEQLAMLARLYPTIRRELARQGELSEIRLPELDEPQQRLEKLRAFVSAGDLWIRISYAGNLNVMVRAAPEVGEDGTYLGVLRTPAADWCVPAGRYYPEESDGHDLEDIASPTDDMDRAQYRVAKIVVEELPGTDSARARRIAERVIEEVWSKL